MKTYKASEEFVVDKHDIGWVGPDFKKHLYDLTFSIEKDCVLSTRTLGRNMNDTKILKEIGPEPVSLGDILTFLKSADKSSWYFFYVKDTEDALWAVHARWYADHGGWHVEALSVKNPIEWSADDQVVSRRFSDSQTKTLSTSDTLPLELQINGFTYRRV